MAQLVGRVWHLTVGNKKLDGFDIDFNIVKTIKPEPNQSGITVKNLPEALRSELADIVSAGKAKAKKQGPTARPTVGVIPVRLEAGYVDPGPDLVFLGDLLTVDSVRQDSTWLTTLSSGSGSKAYARARISQALSAKTEVKKALEACLQALGLGTGNLAKVLAGIKTEAGGTVFPKGKVLTGSASRRLTEICQSAGIEWSIQDGQVQFLVRNGVLPGQAVKLGPTTGLIGSPTVDQDGLLSAECLLISGLRCGGVISLDSTHIKGQFRIEHLTCKGDSRSNTWGYEIQAKRYG